jgi:hypothetical protein
MALQSFWLDLGSFISFLILDIQLDMGSVLRKAVTYTQNNTNTE